MRFQRTILALLLVVAASHVESMSADAKLAQELRFAEECLQDGTHFTYTVFYSDSETGLAGTETIWMENEKGESLPLDCEALEAL